MDSSNDPSIVEDFIAEMTDLNREILSVLKNLNDNINQPEEFSKFSQIIDRIYGTATTLGFKELGNYTGGLRLISRKCGKTKIQRAQKPILALMMNYINNYKLLIESIKYPEKVQDFTSAISLDLKKMEKLEQEIFAYADKKSSIID